MTELVVYVNGSFVRTSEPSIAPLDRGFTLGDGVFETMRVDNGQTFRLGAHLERLRAALAQLDITLPHGDAELEATIGDLLTSNGLRRASVRLAVSRGVPETRGLMPGRIRLGPTVVIQAEPFAGYPQEQYMRGFSAVFATIRRNETSPTAYIKSANYLDSILVRMAAAAAGADEGLMLNMAGNVACGSMSNVFAVTEGRLRTPPITAGILAGITRATVIEIANREHLLVVEDDLTREEFLASDEAFLTNSLMGVMPLTRVDARSIGTGQPGPVTCRLSDLYEEMVQRETTWRA
ncbi:MAG: branched-chain amino acid aminotransferase [Chloroflexota bacterium]|nr:MAG: branched-chain amino acid aminotransferase [Chloroflexota bacterium]